VSAPLGFDDAGEVVEAMLSRVGKRIVLATPLGIGKPNPLLNEIYRRVARERGLSLCVVTALSLARPRAPNALAARLLDPFVARVFGDYVELDYVHALKERRLPANIEIREFFFEPGAWLGVDAAQQSYVSANYTHVVRDLEALGVNVLAQQVAVRSAPGGTEYSLSSNPDLTLELLPQLARARAAGRPVAVVGSVNRRLPFMAGDAVVPGACFDFLLDHPRYEHDLFAPPAAALDTTAHAIGLNASALVRDGGTLQLGIGELGDAVAYALSLRQLRNADYRSALAAIGNADYAAEAIGALGGREPFDRGLYGCTEMLVDGYLDLIRSGVLKRAVYPHPALQRVLDAGEADARGGPALLAALARRGLERMTGEDFAALNCAGMFLPGTRFDAGSIVTAAGERLPAQLGDPEARAHLARALAPALSGGTLLHAGFFLGPRGFYAALRDLAPAARAQLAMTGVSFTNQLYGGDLELKIAQRQHARFINTTMMVTGLGAAVSDALADERVVSGVGGQYNFVAMAHELPDGHSVLAVKSTRARGGAVTSNLVWSYGHTTIPRHLRDVVVSEYGVARLRGATDRECVVALLAITDSRFQGGLLRAAQSAGKLERSYQIPDRHRNNYPQRLAVALEPLRVRGLFTEFPFGSDFSAEEADLARALKGLQHDTASPLGRIATLARACLRPLDRAAYGPHLKRMQLDRPSGWREQLDARLVSDALRRSAQARSTT
jgi:acyl-CoA hydrolase